MRVCMSGRGSNRLVCDILGIRDRATRLALVHLSSARDRVRFLTGEVNTYVSISCSPEPAR